MRSILFILGIVLIFSSCSNDSNTSTSNATPDVDAKMEEGAKGEKGGKAAMMENKDHKYTLTPMPTSHEYPRALINGMTYKDGHFAFELSASGYKLGAQTPDFQSRSCANSAKGQHIHLIVDDLPYAAKYTNEFDYEVADGEHYILAFLSRSYHMSLKGPGQARVRKVTVKDGSFVKEEEVHTSMLFYSRPKGVYTGKANTEKVMLDFYPWVANIGDDTYIVADINGEDQHLITEWRPYYIEGLPMGDNTITLTLMNKDGSKHDSPLNPVTRKFRLVEDQAEIQ